MWTLQTLQVVHPKFPINSADVEAAFAGILLSDEENSSNLQGITDDKVASPRSQQFWGVMKKLETIGKF